MTDTKPSKSARKRDQLALQKLGEELIELKDEELGELPLDGELCAAVRTARSMRSRGALRRQRQLIGKLMRNADADAIRAALGVRRSREQREKRLFAAAERWRDRLVGGGTEALAAFAEETGRPKRELQGLVNEVQHTVDQRREKTLRRELFRRVHRILADDE